MPDPARVGDPTSDGGEVTRGCSSVEIGGCKVARENDEVVTPELGKGSIVEHAKTVEVEGRRVALKGNRCGKGGPGDAGNGLCDVLSMTSFQLLLEQLERDRAALDRGEAPPPKQQMSASPEPEAPREFEYGEKVNRDGSSTYSTGEARTDLGSADLPGGGQVEAYRTQNYGVVQSGNGRYSATALTDNVTVALSSPVAADLQLTGGIDGPSGGGTLIADVGRLDGGNRYGVDLGAGVGGSLASANASAGFEVSALDALGAVPGGGALQAAARRYFPGLDDVTLRGDAGVGAALGDEFAAGGSVVLDTDAERLEVGLRGSLAVLKLDFLSLSVGRRAKKKSAEDVIVVANPNTVFVEGM